MNRTQKACQVCGKSFYGFNDYHYCPECARAKKLDTVVKIRKCQDCGTEFYGGPRAKRCPECAFKAQKENKKRYSKGAKRPLGSVDKCSLCGAEYTVTSGRQKYCSEACQRIGVLKWQREHKKGYAQKSGQEKKRQARREAQEKICVYCLAKFKTDTSTNVCSDFCRQEHKKIIQCIHDIKRGHKRNLKEYEKRREEYRKEKLLGI